MTNETITTNNETPSYLPFGNLPEAAIVHYSRLMNDAWQAFGSPEGLKVSDMIEGAILVALFDPLLVVNAARALVQYRATLPQADEVKKDGE